MNIKLFSFLTAILIVNSVTASQWYVNVNSGGDLFDGTSPVFVAGLVGPKQTINNALISAAPGDTINISEGLYPEMIVVISPIVLRGANWGVSPLTGIRGMETILVPPNLAIGSGISGNTLIEVQSAGVEIDGIHINGNNPNVFYSATKYGKEYEISYGVAGTGKYDYLNLANLIISNFAITGVNMASGPLAAEFNKINDCKIKTGEQNSTAIRLSGNFYADISSSTIDSVGKGLVFENFNNLNSTTFTISYLNITAETNGISISNFSGNTDYLFFAFNILAPFDMTINFTGMTLNNMASTGQMDITNTIINDATTGMLIKDIFANFTLGISDNKVTGGETGIYINQSAITPAINLNINNSEIKNMDSAAISCVSEGGLLTLGLVDSKLSLSAYGAAVLGNCQIVPTNTTFDIISKYYIYLGPSTTSLLPTSDIDATGCLFEGVIGNALVNREPFNVENKIRHYLDNTNLGWVLFKNQNLYVTARDGNNLLASAHTKANTNWNIYLDSINSSEFVTITKTLNLYTHRSAGIGRIVMNGINETLFLHGKLTLTNGLQLIKGFVETTTADTLVLFRSLVNVYPGNEQSYVKGPLYIRYLGLPPNFNISDVIPIGLSNDFRPMYLSAVWPAGLPFIDIGFKSFGGKAPGFSLPTGITHISDVRYWEITNPYNKAGFAFTNVGMGYDTLTINDYINDPTNLNVIYKNAISTYNLAGIGTMPGRGYGLSAIGAPSYGFYAFGNASGGNNILSSKNPVALITVTGHCAKDSITISGENSRSVSKISLWEWKITGPENILSPENSDTIRKKISRSGTYTVTLIATNTIGFSDTISKVFTIDSLPVISYTANLPCFPNSIILSNTSIIPPMAAVSQIEWKMGTSIFTTSTLIYPPAVAGLQTGRLKITLTNGCSDTLPVSVISPTKPTLKLVPNGNVTLCMGKTQVVKITKSVGTLIWNDLGIYDSLILNTVTFKKATIFATPQCSSSDSVNVSLLASPWVNAGPDYKVLPGKQVTLKGTSNGMIEWIPDIFLNDATLLEPTARPLVTTKYILRAYNTTGCEARDTMVLYVDSENTQSVPNLLTPNGDGHNDTWVLSNISDPKNCNVNVFTREGQLVFSSLSYNNNWNGDRINSTPLPDGYYVFVIDHKKSGKTYTGVLTILR